MTKDDDKEVRRLSRALERLDELTKPGSVQREALRKASFALHLIFFRGGRRKLERLYKNPPLSDEERERMRSFGIDLDAG